MTNPNPISTFFLLFYILMALIAIGFILMALPTIIEKRLKKKR